MTLREFYRKLKKIRNKYKIEIYTDGKIRLYDKRQICFCPLTALYYEKTDKIIPLGFFNLIKYELKLTKKQLLRIVASADCKVNDNQFSKTTRKQILEALHVCNQTK